MKGFIGNLVHGVSGGDEILKKENKELKDQLNLLINENKILKDCYFESKSDGFGGKYFGKLLTDVKTVIFEDKAKENLKSVDQFKSFLVENMFINDSINSVDVDYLNQLVIPEENWNESKKLFEFKQKIMQRNYLNLIENTYNANKANSLVEKINKLAQRSSQNQNSKDPEEEADLDLADLTFEDWKNKLVVKKAVKEKSNSNLNDKLENQNKESIANQQILLNQSNQIACNSITCNNDSSKDTKVKDYQKISNVNNSINSEENKPVISKDSINNNNNSNNNYNSAQTKNKENKIDGNFIDELLSEGTAFRSINNQDKTPQHSLIQSSQSTEIQPEKEKKESTSSLTQKTNNNINTFPANNNKNKLVFEDSNFLSNKKPNTILKSK